MYKPSPVGFIVLIAPAIMSNIQLRSFSLYLMTRTPVLTEYKSYTCEKKSVSWGGGGGGGGGANSYVTNPYRHKTYVHFWYDNNFLCGGGGGVGVGGQTDGYVTTPCVGKQTVMWQPHADTKHMYSFDMMSFNVMSAVHFKFHLKSYQQHC